MVNPVHIPALCGVVLAVVSDWRTRRVPNRLTVTMLLIGLIFAALQNGLTGFLNAAAGAALGLAFFLLPFSMGWLGGGDVKLFMGVGALLGSQAIIWVALYSAVAGGVLALLYVLLRLAQSGRLADQTRLSFFTLQMRGANGLSLFRRRSDLRQTLLPTTQAALREKFPYALAIGIGTCIVIWRGYPPLW